MEAPILEGPPTQKGREKWPISATATFGELGATRPADPTLPSRAHLQDYGRRTTPSKLYVYIYIHAHTHIYIYIYVHTYTHIYWAVDRASLFVLIFLYFSLIFFNFL